MIDALQEQPDYAKMLRDGLTTEDLTKIAKLSGSVSKEELDNITLDGKSEGKNVTWQKTQELEGRDDGSITIQDREKTSTTLVDFDHSVPLTAPLSQTTQAAPQLTAGR